MRRFLIIGLISMAMLGCDRPKTIPDADLQKILQEVYLINAYCSTNPINCDSLDIYEPILSKYKYTASDMEYTITNFSKRKSSRLTDVINEAITGLENEYAVYEKQVAVLDTIDVISAERFKKVVYEDSILIIKSLRDTSKLRIKLPAEDGRYTISYNYQFDSTDTNYGVRAQYTIKDSTKFNVATNTNWLRTYAREKVSVTLESSPKSKQLELNLAMYAKSATEPYLTIDSLVVVHYIPKLAALDSMNKILVDYKLLIDGKEYDKATQDSCSLRIHPPRSVAAGSSKR